MTKQQPLGTSLLTVHGSYYTYHFLGNGAQFRVYAIHNLQGLATGRVIKVPLDYQETMDAVRRPLSLITPLVSNDELEERTHKRVRDIMQYRHTLLNIIQGAYSKDPRFMKQLGNLRVLQSPIPAQPGSSHQSYYLPIFYTQDHVHTVPHFMEHFALANMQYRSDVTVDDIAIVKQLVDHFITLNYAIWEYGFFEFVFKPENMGIRFLDSRTIDVIWTDVAEYITDLSQAEVIIKEKRWLHPLMTHKVDYAYMPSILHDYFSRACDKAFTVETLRAHWRKRSQKIEKRALRELKLKSMFKHGSQAAINTWLAEQTIRRDLYSGLAPDRLDNMNIPTNDLYNLLHHRPPLQSVDTVPLGIERKIAQQQEAKHGNPLMYTPLLSDLRGADA